MTDPRPADLAAEPWQLTARAVLATLGDHHLWRELDRPRLSAHVRAIWAEVGPSNEAVEYRIEVPNWWEPRTEARVRVLAERLSVGINGAVRDQHEQEQKSAMNGAGDR